MLYSMAALRLKWCTPVFQGAEEGELGNIQVQTDGVTILFELPLNYADPIKDKLFVEDLCDKMKITILKPTMRVSNEYCNRKESTDENCNGNNGIPPCG